MNTEQTAKRIKLAAHAKELELQTLAGFLQVSRVSLWNRLTGRIRWQPGELRTIAAVLGVSEDYLKRGDHESR